MSNSIGVVFCGKYCSYMVLLYNYFESLNISIPKEA